MPAERPLTTGSPNNAIISPITGQAFAHDGSRASIKAARDLEHAHTLSARQSLNHAAGRELSAEEARKAYEATL